MRPILPVLLALCLSVSLWSKGAEAQSPLTVLELAQIDKVAQSDPDAAILQIDAALGQVDQNDIRTLFDLYELKAALLIRLDRMGEAAPLFADLAHFATQRRAVLERDPIPLWKNAALMSEQSGALRPAREAWLAILQDLRSGGAAKEAQEQALAQIARLTALIGDDLVLDIPDDSGTRSGDGGDGFREVEVFYATDRARSGDDTPSEFYGYQRGPLELGTAMVTIPDSHQPGILEAASIWRLEFGATPSKHVVLQSVTPVEEDRFFDALRTRLGTEGARDAFVFVHGYNVRFDQAAKRAAQMAYDMNFPGVPILYSWPSRGATTGYISDTAVVRLSGRRLSHFLDDLVSRSGARTLHIVAHSMGNRALTDALELLALRRGLGPDSAPVFDQVLFAAPDVDADLFAEMLPTIRPVARRLTLYASKEDWALATSRQLHGDAPRAGQGGADMLANAHIDSVDMSALGEDMLAHSYFADDSSALADIVALFWRNAAPSQRCGLEPDMETLRDFPVWFYKRGTCEDRKLVEIMAHMQRENISDLAGATRVLGETVQDPAEVEALQPLVAKLMSE